tara:strand:+ start:1404 stop:3272 length:1869 start_codon:yes stop_codon:yes gene_type:complete
LRFSFAQIFIRFIVIFFLGIYFNGTSYAQIQPANYQTKIKAGFILNFYKYVEWPNNSIKDTFYIGILKEPEVAKEIKNFIKGKTYGNKKIPFKVTEINNLDQASEFNILFINNSSGYLPERLFKAIGDKSVLVITENYDYNTTMINFFTDDSKIKYQVNLAKTEPRSLIIDNKILTTAFVGEEESWNKELRKLRVQLNTEEQINKQKSQEINELMKKIGSLNASIQEKEAVLNQREKDLYEIQERIQIQRIRFNQLEDQLDLNNEIIQAKQAAIDRSDRKLKTQIQELDQAREDFEEVQKSMSQTLALLENQRLFTTIAVLVSILIAVLLFYSYRNFRKLKSQAVVINQQKMEAEVQRDEISKQHVELEYKTKEITDSINYAKRIQEAMLPPMHYFNKYLPNNLVFYLPKDIVAGDFYWMEEAGDLTIFAAADCTGHGVPGALVSVICANALNRSVREYHLTQPASILDKTLEIVLEKFERSDEDVKDGMDISLCSFNNKTGALQYAGANNPLWVIRKDSNEIEEYKANKQPIGSYFNHEPFTNHSLVLEEGDTAYIFSDGYSDQFGGENGKKFKSINFKALLLSIVHLELKEQEEKIKQAFYDWMGSYEQLDDICVIGFKK